MYLIQLNIYIYRLRKEINRLLRKGMPNINFKVNIEKNSVFGKLHLRQILNFQTSCCNIKIRGLGAKLSVVFYHFNFERNYSVLNSRSPCIFLRSCSTFKKQKL